MNFLLVATMLSSLTLAQNAPEKAIIQGIVATGGYLLGCSVHEGLHGAVGKAYGLEVGELKLYPSRLKNGATTYCSVYFKEKIPQDLSGIFIHSAPYIWDASWLTAYTALVISGKTEVLPDELRILMVVFSTVFLIDWTNGAISNKPTSDQMKILNMLSATDNQTTLIKTVQLAASAVWLSVILSEEFDLFFVQEPQE